MISLKTITIIKNSNPIQILQLITCHRHRVIPIYYLKLLEVGKDNTIEYNTVSLSLEVTKFNKNCKIVGNQNKTNFISVLKQQNLITVVNNIAVYLTVF